MATLRLGRAGAFLLILLCGLLGPGSVRALAPLLANEAPIEATTPSPADQVSALDAEGWDEPDDLAMSRDGKRAWFASAPVHFTLSATAGVRTRDLRPQATGPPGQTDRD